MQFNPTNYPTVSPQPTDTVLIRQAASGDVKSALVSDVSGASNLVQTIALLRAASVDGVASGYLMNVAGYYATGDGGGGQFIYSASSAAVDDGGTVIAPDAGIGRWLRQYSGPVNVLWFGAKGDGATNDSVAFQSAIDLKTANGGGAVFVPAKTFLIADVVIKEMVSVVGEGYSWSYFFDNTHPTQSKIKLATHSKFCFKTTGSQTFGFAFSRLNFAGFGQSATLDGGLLLTGAVRATVDSCSFYNFGGECIRETGSANRYTNLLTFGGQWTAPTRDIGALDIGSNDSYLCNIEAGNQPSNDQVNLYLSAIIIRGGATMAVNVIGEGSDKGFLITGQNNEFSNCRADINYGHGFWIKRIDVLLDIPHSNRFSNCWSHRNGRYAANTYDGFTITTNTSYGNQFTGCRANAEASIGDSHRYGFYDGGAEHTGGTTANQIGNAFTGCISTGHSTAWLAGSGTNNGAAQPAIPGMITIASSTTPSIMQSTVAKLDYAAPVNITAFLNGVHGQDLYILPSNGNVTLVHSGTLVLNTGANKTLTGGQVYHFKNILGNWQEIKAA